MKALNYGRFFCILSILTSFLFFGPSAVADSAETSLANTSISNIKIVGNIRLSENDILSRVRSRVGHDFISEVAAEDAKRIADLPEVSYSYYNTEIRNAAVELTFVVVEKNIIRSITFRGNSKMKSKKLRGKLGYKVGDTLDPLMARSAIEKLLEYYKKKGYPFVEIGLDESKLSGGILAYDVYEGPRVLIKSVGFRGNSALSIKDLKKTVKTKRKKFLILKRYYQQKALDKDLTKLRNIYYERGHLGVDVVLEKQFNADKSAVDLIFVISEGPAYIVESISVLGNRFYDDASVIEKTNLSSGAVYNQTNVNSGTKELKKLYLENGFIEAQVDQKIEYVSKSTLRLLIEINEGDRFRIGQINITGNKETRDYVVRRVLDEYEFTPGNWYNADIAHGDSSGYLEKLVRSTTYSEDVRINPFGEESGIRDAQVNVTEGQTGMVMLGAGLASDSGVIGQLTYEQRNFDITDRPESLMELITGKAFKGAGQTLRISLQPGTEVSEYSVSFSEPYFRNKPMSLNVTGSSYERDRESYDEERIRGYVGFEKRLKDKWRKSIQFRLEDVDVANLDTDAPKEIIDIKGSNLIAGVKFGIGRDLTDDRFNPSKGYSYNTNYEQVGGDHTFGVLSGTYRHFKTLYEDIAEQKTILSTKFYAAAIVGNAPSFEKFYAGGSQSIRGFDYRGISTRGLQTNVPTPERKDPVGSDWIAVVNAEVAVPLVGDNFAALFFVDSGVIDTGGPRVSIGTGIQIMIPRWFGPVPMRFEIAAPLMKDGEDETQVFSFSIGKLF